MMRIYVLFLLFGLATSPLLAQDHGYIYGTVHTHSGNSYSGQLRWGGEEALWSDLFNAAKLNNQVFGHVVHEDKVKQQESDSWWGIDWSLTGIWENKQASIVHLFSCTFGDLQSIQFVSHERVYIKLKNGVTIQVGGSGYNDLQAGIEVMDAELGQVNIRKSQIDRVDFGPTPASLQGKDGRALYGHLITVAGDTLTGYLQWDKQERLTSDILDGNAGTDRMKLPFSRIQSLMPMGGRCKVILLSGRAIVLNGTNDVNERNKGAVVWVANVGRVEVPWKHIKQMQLLHDHNSSGQPFEAYGRPSGLKGSVTLLEGEKYEGWLAFDLDEVWEFELLDGYANGLDYYIPFRNIKRITPRNRQYSLIELKQGGRLVLGNKRDVSEQNEGVLVFPSKDAEPKHIKWYLIDHIQFD